jgi:hypothetical protein
VAAAFVIASALGVVCASNALLTMACLVAVAALASIVCFGVRLGPPGPMHFVLVAGVSGHLAALARRGGTSLNAFEIPALVLVGALSAYAVVAVLLALGSSPVARVKRSRRYGFGSDRSTGRRLLSPPGW